MKNNKFYQRVHDFVRREKSVVLNCEHCGLKKKLDNALIHGKNHEKNINNYISLCRKCHYHYDHPNGINHTDVVKKIIGKHSSKRIKKNGVNINFINSQKGKKQSQETKDKRAKSLKKEIVHGTLTGYHNYKCRCAECKAFYSNYQKKYRKNEK